MINIKNIEVSYNTKKVIKHLNLDFNPNKITFILGPNGAGKSTLLKSINGIKKIDSGNIIINDKSIARYDEKALAKIVAFVPQEFHLQFDFNVYEFILMARYPWLNYWGHYQEKDHQIASKYIDLLHLNEFKDRFYNQLSGGEKQKVLIARALVQDTTYVLFDESLSFLDINHQIEVLKILKEINRTESKTIIMISHNLNLAAEFADRIVFIKNGDVFITGSTAEVYNEKVLSDIFDYPVSMVKNPYTNVENIVYNPKAALSLL